MKIITLLKTMTLSLMIATATIAFQPNEAHAFTGGDGLVEEFAGDLVSASFLPRIECDDDEMLNSGKAKRVCQREWGDCKDGCHVTPDDPTDEDYDVCIERCREEYVDCRCIHDPDAPLPGLNDLDNQAANNL